MKTGKEEVVSALEELSRAVDQFLQVCADYTTTEGQAVEVRCCDPGKLFGRMEEGDEDSGQLSLFNLGVDGWEDLSVARAWEDDLHRAMAGARNLRVALFVLIATLKEGGRLATSVQAFNRALNEGVISAACVRESDATATDHPLTGGESALVETSEGLAAAGAKAAEALAMANIW